MGEAVSCNGAQVVCPDFFVVWGDVAEDLAVWGLVEVRGSVVGDIGFGF